MRAKSLTASQQQESNMASKSKATTKKSEDEWVGRCAWCDKYGEMLSRKCVIATSFGRDVGVEKVISFCNQKCVIAHAHQEVAIDLRKEIEKFQEYLKTLSNNYMEILGFLKDCPDDAEYIKKGEYLFSEIKLMKAQIDFNESLLRREKKDILTMKRYKCLKLAGDVYEMMQELETKKLDDFTAKEHNAALSTIGYYNDEIDKYGDTKISGAVAHILIFGTD